MQHLSAFFALFLQLSSASPASLGEGVTVRQLTERVWVHTSSLEVPGYGLVPANGLILVGSKESVLVDTPWTDRQTAVLFEWAAKRDAPVGKVVPTHFHEDCMGGLAEAHRRQAASFAHKLTQEFARERGLEIPQIGFAEELSLDFEGKRLDLRYCGKAHTADNIVVWIPDDRVLFGGCLAKATSSKTLGNTSEADLGAWSETIQLILKTYPDARFVVPGHGEPGTAEILHHTAALLAGRIP